MPNTLTTVTPLSKTIAAILFILLPLLSFFFGIQYQRLLTSPPTNNITPNKPEGVACTMEAKICPDGTAVGRIPPCCEFAPCPPSNNTINKTMKGTVKSGAQLENKAYCSAGLYLVADEGTYLINQAKELQLRLPDSLNYSKMFTDQSYLDKKVTVVGRYPTQEGFCEALICECEDYILVESIEVLEKSCLYNDITYRSGEGFPAEDGCNSCSCQNGEVNCTLIAC